jgi:glycosyltransferase involved in cell wall biosynthesis
MNSINEKKIPCSVGILTYNSGKTLRRALESVKDFTDIIIADGGSTDETLLIAEEYGCKLIEQIAKVKPGPEPRHPIVDFAAERNQLIAAAREDWFLWIDSDEYISKELATEIKQVTLKSDKQGYRIPIVLQSTDTLTTYCLPKQAYQMRFFNLSQGGSFQRKIHERYVFHSPEATIGTLNGAWYVPISKPDFKTYSWAVNYRLRLMVEQAKPITFTKYVKLAWLTTSKNVLGIFSRFVVSYLTIPWSKVLPAYYFRNRLYSQWVLFKVTHQLYFEKK